MHECPQKNCQQIIPETAIACDEHWFTVPKELRDEVETADRLWSRIRAIQVAIEAMNHMPETDEPRILWEECGMRCVRYGGRSDGYIRFESGLYNQNSNIVDWQEVTAVQIEPLLRILGEHFLQACRIADQAAAREEDYASA